MNTDDLKATLQRVGNGLADFFVPETKKLVTGQSTNNLIDRQNARQNKKGDIIGAIKNAGLDTLDLLGTAAKPAAEIASFMVPVAGGNTLKAATALGGLSGGLRGASMINKPGDILPDVAGGIAGGALAGGGIYAGRAGLAALAGHPEWLSNQRGAIGFDPSNKQAAYNTSIDSMTSSPMKGPSLGSVNNAFKNAFNPADTLEQTIEQKEGWAPGVKKVFELALFNKDVPTIQKLLPQLPAKYAQDFASVIAAALGK